jgi:hypothetical protein
MRPDPTFHASPKLAMQATPENFAYTLLLSIRSCTNITAVWLVEGRAAARNALCDTLRANDDETITPREFTLEG